jgi:alpha-tubulin suppressor-like RCC1 family protein
MEAGESHTCALTSGGGVKCWGDNAYGQLGDGTQFRRLAAVDVAGLAGGVTAIAAGFNHTCAVTTGGGVRCWGRNSDGQLGDGTFNHRLTPVDVQGLPSGVIAIAAGHYHTCALTSGGAVTCWGWGGIGQLGDGTTSTRATAAEVDGLGSGVLALATGAGHTCALTGGGVKCWGGNDSGQLGDGTFDNRLTPVNVQGLTSGVSAIAAGYGHTCALTTGGGVKCWGANASGQLGDDTTNTRATAAEVTGLGSGVIAIAGGGWHTCALTGGGGVKCWGENESGQLGDDTHIGHLTPVNVAGLATGATAIALGGSHSCALGGGGAVKCWGGNYQGQLGNGSDPTRPIAADVSGLGSGVSKVMAGGWHTCALTTGGAVKCWGANWEGQLGDDTYDSRGTAAEVNGLGSGVIAIAAGGEHTCALTSAGGVKCWGANASGQLGDDTHDSRATAADVTGLGSGVIAIAASGSHTCALNTGGGVKCWGANESGQVGDGTSVDNRPTPVDVQGLTSGVIAITAGGAHTGALTTGGGVKCWGANGEGQLGDDTYNSRPTAADVLGLGSGVIAIAAGGNHSCALTSGGGVKCWGAKWNADGSATTHATAGEVTSLGSGVDALAAGGFHTCARTSGGAMKCWGGNFDGQLGDGTHNNRSTPLDVSGLGSGVSAMAAGGNHTCAVTDGGAAKCWGYNGDGQLGDGTIREDSVPLPGNAVKAVPDRLAIAALNGGVPIVAGAGFSVRIESRELALTGAVQTATAVGLALTTGIGPLTGSTSCTIPAGGSSCTVSGLKLATAQIGAVITALRSSGDSLADGASLPFNVDVPVASAPLDVDASVTATRYDSLTDGLLVIRYLFGLTGSALTANATGPTAARTDAAVIEAYLDMIRPALDIDGNGTADALTDGLLVVRYLSGLRGASLIQNALDPTAARTTATAIESYLETLMP